MKMKIYDVSYWGEGPGRSGTRTIRVLARTKKEAIKLVNKNCGVYKADQEMTEAKYLGVVKPGILGPFYG